MFTAGDEARGENHGLFPCMISSRRYRVLELCALFTQSLYCHAFQLPFEVSNGPQFRLKESYLNVLKSKDSVDKYLVNCLKFYHSSILSSW